MSEVGYETLDFKLHRSIEKCFLRGARFLN